MAKIEAIVAVYGIPDEQGQMMTYSDAKELQAKLKTQYPLIESASPFVAPILFVFTENKEVRYRLTNARIDGNWSKGYVVAEYGENLCDSP